jgi:hypothetical protein
MDPNELQAVSEALNQLREGSTISAETLAKLGGTTQSANKALESYTKKLLGAASAAGSMAKSVAEGEGSFKSLGSSIVGLTSIVGKLASAIPLVGGAAKALAEGVGEASKFILDQLDTMAKNYQTLGDASAGAADGVDGLLRQFNQLGNYSLPAFAKAVKANTLGLSALGGTAALGAEELSKVSGVLTTGDTARKFLKLGISLDGVGDAAASFISNSSRLGLLQGDTTEELTKKTQNYILEVDKIARMTGQTREQQQQEAQKTLLNTRFRAKLADMAANGQADAALQLKNYAEGMGGAAGDAIRAYATGIPATKEAARAGILFNDAFRQNTESIKAGKHATDAINDTMLKGADGAKRFSTLLQFGGDKFGGAANQALDYQEQVAANLRKGMSPAQAAEAAQKAQAAAAGDATNGLVDASLATANASKNLQDLGFSLAEFAIPAVETFANVLDGATSFARKRWGTAGSKINRGGMDRGPVGGPGVAQTGKLAGVNTDLATAVAKAAEEYKKRTGHDATITSGVRDREKQTQLYNAWVASGKKGPVVAAPGTSKHETGNAVDIDSKAANEMASMGILSKYGLTRPVAGEPWHTELAGPSGRYPSKVTGINNPTTAASETQLQSNRATEQPSGFGGGSFGKKLDELIALQRQSNAIEAKILQHAKA